MFAFRDGYLLIYADGADPIFKCLPEETEAGELMSLEGIVITAPIICPGTEAERSLPIINIGGR